MRWRRLRIGSRAGVVRLRPVSAEPLGFHARTGVRHPRLEDVLVSNAIGAGEAVAIEDESRP